MNSCRSNHPITNNYKLRTEDTTNNYLKDLESEPKQAISGEDVILGRSTWHNMSFLFCMEFNLSAAQQKAKLSPKNKATVIQTVWHCCKDRHSVQGERTESQKLNPDIYGQLVFDKVSKNPQWGKSVSSTNGAGATGYPHKKEWSWTLTSHHTFNKVDQRPKPKSQTIKRLGKNTRLLNLYDFWFSNGFLDMTTKGTTVKLGLH